MQLDHTRISIRERSLGEILDLSLHVIRQDLLGILWRLAVVAIPLMGINAWLLRNITAPVDETELLGRYIWALLQLTFIEAPLGTLLITPYLGQSLFMGNPTLWGMLRGLGPAFLRFLYCQGIRRGIVPAMILASFIPSSFSYSGQEGWLTLIAVIVLVQRLARPYLSEIVLLERNPITSKSSQVATISRRSRSLHASGAGDLTARFLISMLIGLALLASLLGTSHFLLGTLFFDWDRGIFYVRCLLPLQLWLLAGFMAVIRFLGYLDLRIRNEGWEVELLIRAASQDVLAGASANNG